MKEKQSFFKVGKKTPPRSGFDFVPPIHSSQLASFIKLN